MKCPVCRSGISKGKKICAKCGYSTEDLWLPDIKWHLKALLVIYMVLLIVYVLILKVL